MSKQKNLKQNNPPHRVTIRDVAEAAGVSVSTVSHVLNDYEDISPETKQLVRRTMNALNYYPSASARRLTRRRSHLFHLLLFAKEGLHHPFFYEVICGIAEATERVDYELILSVQQADDGQGRWRHSLRRCVESRVEGLIIMGSLPDRAVFEKVEAIQIPVVCIDIPYDGSYGVSLSSDNETGARLAVEHLLKLGHKKIAFLGGDSSEPSLISANNDDCQLKGSVLKSRFLGYSKALGAHDLELDPSLIGPGQFTQAGAQAAVLEILKEHRDLTAVFAASDVMAIGAIQAAHSVGKRVPEDLAVVGYDDIEAASLVSPLLTTIRQNGEEMGQRAVQELQDLIEEPEPRPAEVILPVELVIRESCGATAGK